MLVRAFETADVPAMRDIWNEVVRAENAFPQVEELGSDEAEKFFAAQSFSGVAAGDDGKVLGTRGYSRCGVSCPVDMSPVPRKTDKKAFVKLLSGFGGCNAAALFRKGGER